MSGTSPLRPSFMSHKRTVRDSNVSKYPNLTHKSPALDSPYLNEESQMEQHKQNLNSDLKMKLQILLKQNSQLLNENAQLSELVNSLRAELDVRIRREQTEFAKINQQMGSVMVQLKGQQELHQSELERLLKEISALHDQCHQLQIQKSNELRRQQEVHQREMVHQIAQMRRSQEEARSLMDLHICKLKQTVQMKDFQYQSLQTQMRGEVEQLKNENALLQSQIDHQRKLKDLQINEINRRAKDDMRSALRQMELSKNMELKQYQNRIMKLKKDICSKDMQIEQHSKKNTGQNQEIHLQLSSIKKEKQYLLEEIQSLTQTTQEKLVREKERIAQLSELQKENMENLFKNEKQALIGEKQKLMSLSVQKSEQIKRLYETMKKMKESADTERQQYKSIIQGLRNRLREIQRSNAQETQLLKIKMAQLHRADVQSLEKFYQNQVAALHLEVNQLRQTRDVDRQKLYNLLQENDELRKNFQVEISKQKAKIQDMKVKFAAARLQFKEQITSLGTKMELTSQSLIRQTQQKQKGVQFFQTEKRKFYQIIEEKDKQIQSIHQTMIRLKELNEQQITQLKIQINLLRSSLLAKDQQFKEYKANLEQEFQRKSTKLIEEANAVSPDDILQKQHHQLKGKFTQIEKDNFKKQKEIQFLQRQVRSLQQQLGLRAGFIETMQLQSCAAIQDQKSKVKILMGKNEVAMKDYYENKLISREHDNQNLRKQLTQKESDLRSIVTKYHHLERKLKELLEAQSKLSDFENKIIQLGLDQNLIKNMAELFHNKQ